MVDFAGVGVVVVVASVFFSFENTENASCTWCVLLCRDSSQLERWLGPGAEIRLQTASYIFHCYEIVKLLTNLVIWIYYVVLLCRKDLEGFIASWFYIYECSVRPHCISPSCLRPATPIECWVLEPPISLSRFWNGVTDPGLYTRQLYSCHINLAVHVRAV